MPKQVEVNKKWHLNKSIYCCLGRCLTLLVFKSPELCKLGARPSKLEQVIFYFCKHSEVVGVIILLTDNIMWAGKPTFSNNRKI